MAERTYRKGDFVHFKLGNHPFNGTVQDDAARIGIDGREYCVVEFHLDWQTIRKLELLADSLQKVDTSAVQVNEDCQMIFADELDQEYDYTYMFKGRPFTGVTLEVSRDGKLIAATSYVEGAQTGIARE